MAHFSPAARGLIRRRAGEMNELEREFFNTLELRRHAGEFTYVYFEQMTFKLGPDLRYTPDFMAQSAEGGFISLYETKGFFRDDSRVKIIAAAQMFPMFTFYLARKVRGAWDIQEV
jgi:hypothetical protein